MSAVELPLFPLNTVLFPDGPLPLRIFEPRYLDMVSRCMKEDLEFGVLLIRSGEETGPAETVELGTLARIRDWCQREDGLLGITAVGTRRFRCLSARRQADGLLLGRIEPMAPLPRVDLPERYRSMGTLLSRVLGEFDGLYDGIERRPDDAAWVSCRMAEILPLRPEERQRCLEFDDPVERLDFVAPFLRKALPEAG